MSQLTNISGGARKAVLIVVMLLVAYFLFIFLIRMIILIWRSSHQPKRIQPDVRFGQLDSPRFVNYATTSAGLTFSLLTIEGAPPESTASAKVYEIAKKLPTFSTGLRVTSLARRLGFDEEPTINDTTYYFVDSANSLRSLVIEGVYLNFHLKYNYRGQSAIFVRPLDVPKEQLIKNFTNFLSQKGIFDDTVLKGRTALQLLRYNTESGELIPAKSIADAHAMRIDFFRQDVDNLPLVPPKYFTSYNYVLHIPKPGRNDAQLLEISYSFWPLSDNFATYPLKTANEAYTELIEGKAYIINKGFNESEITLRNIHLAYFDDDQIQPYLQPVFVFAGDREFVAMSPAISSQWLK